MGVYLSFTKYYQDHPELEMVIVTALQTEVDIRFLNNLMRTLKQAGFHTRKKFEELVADTLPDDGRNVLPALKLRDFIREREDVIIIGNSRKRFDQQIWLLKNEKTRRYSLLQGYRYSPVDQPHNIMPVLKLPQSGPE